MFVQWEAVILVFDFGLNFRCPAFGFRNWPWGHNGIATFWYPPPNREAVDCTRLSKCCRVTIRGVRGDIRNVVPRDTSINVPGGGSTLQLQ